MIFDALPLEPDKLIRLAVPLIAWAIIIAVIIGIIGFGVGFAIWAIRSGWSGDA